MADFRRYSLLYQVLLMTTICLFVMYSMAPTALGTSAGATAIETEQSDGDFSVRELHLMTAAVPVIMYHSLVGCDKNTLIQPEAFEADLKYLQEQGYHSVFLTDLVKFVYEGIPLPDKPVVLTFDDGYYNNYSIGLPLLEKYGMNMVVSVIGVYSEDWSRPDVEKTEGLNERYAHVSWTHIHDMANSGYVEIANHTWDLHKMEKGRKGCMIKYGEDKESYGRLLREDVGKLQQSLADFSGVTPVAFTYPFGHKCPEAEEVLKNMGFKVTLGVVPGINVLTEGDAMCLYELHRFNRTSNRPVQSILESLNHGGKDLK